MQIISTNKIIINLTAFILFFLIIINVEAKELLRLSINPGKTFYFDVNSIQVSVFEKKLNVRKKITISKKIKLHLKAADELYTVFSDPISTGDSNIFLILSRERSLNKNALGFCGAGYEDYLILVDISNDAINLLDEILIQSCLKSIELK